MYQKPFCRLLQLLSLLLLLLVNLSLAPSSQFSTRPDPEWKADVEKILAEFQTCGGPTPPNTPCNIFLARALKRIYFVNDFDKPSGGYMTANEMANFVQLSDKWTKLGDGGKQDVLTNAQGYANLKKPVIAVQENPGAHGHVVLIIPGDLTASGGWGLNCPNSASFFLDAPAKSYVGKHLGYAFKKPDNVVIYGRNKDSGD